MTFSKTGLLTAVALLFITVQSSQAQLFGKTRPKLFGRCLTQQAHCNRECCNNVSNQTIGSSDPVQPPRTCREQSTQDSESCNLLRKPEDRAKCMAIAQSRRRRCPPLGEFNPRPIETDGRLETTPEQCLEDYNLCIEGLTNPADIARCEDIFFNCLRNSTPLPEDPPIPTCELPRACDESCETVRYCRPTLIEKRILRLRCR